MIDLFKYQDLKYKEFNDHIINTKNKTIGIRMPILKKIALNLVKTNTYKDYLLKKNNNYYEEIMLHGLILGYLDLPFNKLIKQIDVFISLIDNWSINDSVCANMHTFKNNQDDGFKYIKKLIKGNEWRCRFGLVLLINYYVNDEYIDDILNICLHKRCDFYYVNMAICWLLQACYVKYPIKTLDVIKSPLLDTWIRNKSISKICDSLKVDKKDKEYLRTLRIK